MQPTETHWTRIFYCDLYAPHAAARVHEERKETAMPDRNSRDPHRPWGGTPLGAALVLLGIYIAMYLAVAEVVHILSPADAAAAEARDIRTATAPAPDNTAVDRDRAGAGHAHTD